jgi:hypothetical protein
MGSITQDAALAAALQERAELCRALLYAVLLSPNQLKPATVADILCLLEHLVGKVKAAGGVGQGPVPLRACKHTSSDNTYTPGLANCLTMSKHLWACLRASLALPAPDWAPRHLGPQHTRFCLAGCSAPHMLVQQASAVLLAAVAVLSLKNVAGGVDIPVAAMVDLLRSQEVKEQLDKRECTTYEWLDMLQETRPVA